MKRFILSVLFMICIISNTWAAQKAGESITKVYENKDGTTYTASLTLGSNGRSGSSRFDGSGVVAGTDGNIAFYDQAGELIAQGFYHNARVTYVADEHGNIMGVKGCFDCSVLYTFKYTDSDKVLVYGTDGTLSGVYDSLLDFHTANAMGRDYWDGRPSGYAQYIDHSLNLVDEDGKYYERNAKGNIVAIYEGDGSISKYEYDSGGNLSRQYDSQGNVIWARRIYTVEEAAAVVKPQGNTFRIKYK